MILSEIVKTSPSKIIDLFIADFSTISGNDKLYFFSDTNELGANVTFAGIVYTAYPFELTGLEWNGSGQLPTPKLKMANINGFITALNMQYQDLLGLRITRVRTMLKYLDAINFTGNTNPTADPTAKFIDEVYYIDRKVTENNMLVEYDLVSALDISSIKLPRRLIIQNTCQWRYKSAECGYIPGSMFTSMGIPTTDAMLDICGKRLSDCKLRFGATNILNYGGFPGAGLFS